MKKQTGGKRSPRPKKVLPEPAVLIETIFTEFVRFSRLNKSEVVAELKGLRFPPPAIPKSDGWHYPVSDKALSAAGQLVESERASDSAIAAKISSETYTRLSMLALGDTIASTIAGESEMEYVDVLASYRACLATKIAQVQQDLYHHVPCHIFHADQAASRFTIGPVEFFPRDVWLSQHIQDKAVRDLVTGVWGRSLSFQQVELDATKNGQESAAAASAILNTIGAREWVATVLVEDHEATPSDVKANVLVSVALDSLSLLLNARHGAALNKSGQPFFRGARRLATTKRGSLVRGSSARLPGVGGPPGMAMDIIDGSKVYRNAAGIILAAYAKAHESDVAPGLIERWVNALHLFGEARRDNSDFMAIVNYGNAIDILSGAGGNLSQLVEYAVAAFGAGVNKDYLKQSINQIYNDGRSALSHGEAFGLLAERAEDRARADSFTQQLLQQVTEELSAVVASNHRMLTLDKKLQVKAFKTRLSARK